MVLIFARQLYSKNLLLRMKWVIFSHISLIDLKLQNVFRLFWKDCCMKIKICRITINTRVYPRKFYVPERRNIYIGS